MESLKIYTRANNGQVRIAIPEEMEDMNLQIVVTPSDKLTALSDEEYQQHMLQVNKRAESMTKLAGTAPYPDYKLDEDEWYHQ